MPAHQPAAVQVCVCPWRCGKHLTSPSRPKRHGKLHQGCMCQKDKCSFAAKTWTELLKHVRETHKEDIKCEVCQKTFKCKDYLKQHLKTHAPERDVCRCPREGCSRTYTTVFNLQSHILSFHEERRPFTCEQEGCGKTFAMKVSTQPPNAILWVCGFPARFLGALGFQMLPQGREMGSMGALDRSLLLHLEWFLGLQNSQICLCL